MRRYGSGLRRNESVDKAKLHYLFEYLASNRERVFAINDDPLIGELAALEVHIFDLPFDGQVRHTVFLADYLTRHPNLFVSYIASNWCEEPRSDLDFSLDDAVRFHLYVPFFPNVSKLEFASWMDNMLALFDDPFLEHQALAKIYSSAPTDSNKCPLSYVLDYYEPKVLNSEIAVEILVKLQNIDNSHTIDGITLSLKAKRYLDIYEKTKEKYPNIAGVYQQIADDMLRWNENEKESLR